MPSNSPSPKKPIYPIPQEPASNQEACSPTEPTKKTSIQDIQDRRSLELIIGSSTPGVELVPWNGPGYGPPNRLEN